MSRFFRPWAWPSELRRAGILGINRRNADFVMPENPRTLYPRVDDKLVTKQICEQRGIPVPKTYAVIERQGDIRRFAGLVAGRNEFVIKPASGCEGRGIIVINEQCGDIFTTSSGEQLHLDDLRYHLSTILSGLYSLAGQDDRAIVEQRIARHTIFQQVAVGGTPDIRVVLFRCVPVMAMIRLPTRESRGRANLHQGAVAAAINLKSGITFGGVYKNRTATMHPDTNQPLAGLAIPAWGAILTAAMHLAAGLELGYVGVDFVLDASGLPFVLEANARPGLAIQVAHRTGLLPRLQLVAQQSPEKLQPGRCDELVAAIAALD